MGLGVGLAAVAAAWGAGDGPRLPGADDGALSGAATETFVAAGLVLLSATGAAAAAGAAVAGAAFGFEVVNDLDRKAPMPVGGEAFLPSSADAISRRAMEGPAAMGAV